MLITKLSLCIGSCGHGSECFTEVSDGEAIGTMRSYFLSKIQEVSNMHNLTVTGNGSSVL